MSKRSYSQACSLAFALDLIGERWTWLIIRALLTGPKRYGELLEQLPGIGTNLLSDRMKTLVRHGVAEKSGKGRQSAYSLTALGEELRPITHQLIRWGRHFSRDGDERDSVSGESLLSMPEWDMLALEAAFAAEKADGIQAVMQLTLSGFTFHLVIKNNSCRAISGPAVEPDVCVITDSATLIDIGGKRTSLETAEEKVKLKIEGDRSVFNQLFQLFD
jgi:DNA-binding HxlR family transcriptional regulator